MKITVIGYGKMAKAMIAGFVSNDFEVEVVGRNSEKLSQIKETYNSISTSILSDFDISDKNIILAVKPYVLEEVSKQLKGKANLIISILAGTKLQTLENLVASKYHVRAMPNLSAAYLKSMTTIVANKETQNNIELKNIIDKALKSVGKILWLNSEKELDIATGIAGSGPAFLSIVAEALADGGVNCGLKRDDAKEVVKGLFYSFSDILEDYQSPALIKDDVMSPAGTTSAGVITLESNGVRDAFIKAIDNATQRAKSIANN
jgi:pyrroline-5-carboxylate reductase